jgi:hypothetical protein
MCPLPAAAVLMTLGSAVSGHVTATMNVAAVVPEPTTLALAIAAVLTVLIGRKLR